MKRISSRVLFVLIFSALSVNTFASGMLYAVKPQDGPLYGNELEMQDTESFPQTLSHQSLALAMDVGIISPDDSNDLIGAPDFALGNLSQGFAVIDINTQSPQVKLLNFQDLNGNVIRTPGEVLPLSDTVLYKSMSGEAYLYTKPNYAQAGSTIILSNPSILPIFLDENGNAWSALTTAYFNRGARQDLIVTPQASASASNYGKIYLYRISDIEHPPGSGEVSPISVFDVKPAQAGDVFLSSFEDNDGNIYAESLNVSLQPVSMLLYMLTPEGSSNLQILITPVDENGKTLITFGDVGFDQQGHVFIAGTSDNSALSYKVYEYQAPLHAGVNQPITVSDYQLRRPHLVVI